MICSGRLRGQTVPVDLRIEVTEIGKENGEVHVALYNSSPAFMKTDRVFRSKIIPVRSQDSLSFTLAQVPPGKYALAVFLDRNDNNKLDMNLFGIPKEKYGFSGDKRPLFRAPNFDEAAFEVSEKNRAVTIKLR